VKAHKNWKGNRMKPRKIVYAVPCALLIALTLPGCASRISISANEAKDICEFAWKPQGWHIQDTDKTILEAKRNNARRAAWCGK
jgi:hypothetical protein